MSYFESTCSKCTKLIVTNPVYFDGHEYCITCGTAKYKELGHIPFTQYLRPYGHKQPIWIDCFEDEKTNALAASVIEDGFVFEIEQLTTGMISMTSHHKDDVDQDLTISMRLCSNGPDVPRNVKKLVESTAKMRDKEKK